LGLGGGWVKKYLNMAAALEGLKVGVLNWVSARRYGVELEWRRKIIGVGAAYLIFSRRYDSGIFY
jgi:hypothetical protein